MTDTPAAPPLAERVLQGDPRAIARGISLIEDDRPEGAALIRQIFQKTGGAYLVGVTGSPGSGKSTLVDRLIAEWRRRGRTVGVLAVDPTSPFSGGAILGDRVRMQMHAGDAGVFIRSMATRGHLGGLARATGEAALVLDASGKDVVVIETVGVGQDEVDVVRTADISVVMLVPGTGDEVQALKAGIMEIGDIFVVNKADREGADRTVASVEAMLSLESPADDRWRPPILKTEATRGAGVDALVDAVDRFRAAHADVQGQRRRTRAQWRVRELLSDRFLAHVHERVLEPGELERFVDRIAARVSDPYSVADDIVRRALQRDAHGAAVLDHVGIAVSNVHEAIAFYRDAVGLEIEAPEDVASQGVRAHFVPAGGAALELLEGTAPDSPITKYLARRGPGLHHLTLRVPDIRAALARLKAHGVRLIDEEPRPGAHGSLVAFVHPSSAHGVLVELKEPADR